VKRLAALRCVTSRLFAGRLAGCVKYIRWILWLRTLPSRPFRAFPSPCQGTQSRVGRHRFARRWSRQTWDKHRIGSWLKAASAKPDRSSTVSLDPPVVRQTRRHVFVEHERRRAPTRGSLQMLRSSVRRVRRALCASPNQAIDYVPEPSKNDRPKRQMYLGLE
jgi:hypothetical protein